MAAIASLDGLPRRPLGPEEPANHDYVANIRAAIHQLVSIEMKLGSDELAPLALRWNLSGDREGPAAALVAEGVLGEG